MRIINPAGALAATGARRSRRHMDSLCLPLAVVMASALLAGCGGTSSSHAALTGGSSHNAQTKVASAAANSHAGAQTTVSGDPRHKTKKPSKPSMLAFAKCMRAHGVPDFPDPSQLPPPPAGGQTMQAGSSGGFTANPNSPAYQRASKDCHSLAVASPVSQSQGSEMMTAQLKFSICMRAHGVPNYPDPTSTGEVGNDGATPGVNENSPAFQTAEKKCEKLRPLPPALPGGG